MGFERNYQVKIPSKQLFICFLPLIFFYFTGLIDGSFIVIVTQSKTHNRNQVFIILIRSTSNLFI
jgi:hypothetical protein